MDEGVSFYYRGTYISVWLRNKIYLLDIWRETPSHSFILFLVFSGLNNAEGSSEKCYFPDVFYPLSLNY
jgi:hypothetical protein